MKKKEQNTDDSYVNMSDPERHYKGIMIREIKDRISSRIQNDDPVVANTLKSLIDNSVLEVKKK